MRRTPHSRPRRAAQGFNLVILVMAVTVLNIMLALALPAWSSMIQREKENELIFRGLQYAEAIRVFQTRHGRLPTKITELIEVQPRSIRQLWKNPMAEDGAWLLLPAQAQGNPQGRPVERAGEPPRNRQEQRNQRNQAGQPGQPGQPGRQQPLQAVRVVPPRPGEPVLTAVATLPFIGVASPEGETSLKTFMGSNEIKEWRFTVDLVSAMQQSPDLSFSRPVHAGMFWRPFPPGVTPPNQAQNPQDPNAVRPGGMIQRQIQQQQNQAPRPGNQQQQREN